MIIMRLQKCDQVLLKLDHISLSFGGLQALNHLCLNADNSSQIHGIIGPNGAGKSTLFNVVTGIYKPKNGSIYFNGFNISNASTLKIVEKGISRTFQNIRLLPNLNILENLKMGSVASGFINADRAYEILSFLGLSKVEKQMPDFLPYGDRRKIEIGRSLMQNPRLLLLDEPAAGMNPTEKQELADLIQKIASPTLKVIVIEHDMKFIMNLCEVISVINQGAVIAEGSPLEIQSNKQVIDVYLGNN